MWGNQRGKELVILQSVAIVARKITHNINKAPENKISSARNCAILDSGTTGIFVHLQILLRMKAFA